MREEIKPIEEAEYRAPRRCDVCAQTFDEANGQDREFHRSHGGAFLTYFQPFPLSTLEDKNHG